MSAIRAIGRTLFAAVKADTSSASSAAAAAASTARTKHNPLEDFFEADRSPDDDKPVVYGINTSSLYHILSSLVFM